MRRQKIRVINISTRITLNCGLVSMHSVLLYNGTERSIKDAVSSDEQNHITIYGLRPLHCGYP